MKITSKGQITIPIDIRDRAGLLPGTNVEFSIQGDTVLIRKSKKVAGMAGRGARLVELMRGTAKTRLTTDQIMALTRGD